VPEGMGVSEATRLERTTHAVAGDRAELQLKDGVITIHKSATAQARPTEVTVPIDRVRSVEVRKPSRTSSGWLHVAVVDGSPAPVTELAAMSDPYTIPIVGRQVTAARRLERLVADHVQRRGLPPEEPGSSPGPGPSGVVLTDAPTTASAAPTMEPSGAGPSSPDGDGRSGASASSAPPPPPPPDPPAPEEDLTTKLRELAELHRSGALTDEEFRRAKQSVLEA
jgi:hypothetical protein